jgi:pyrimidine-nucleoside phosphorylase
MAMNFLSLIEAKRDGGRHGPGEIAEVVRELVAGNLPDYQVAAWLMAIFFRGLDRQELSALTMAMRDSGERLEFPDDPRPLVDKHSTGGVGDKVSLPLAPLLAALGFRVPMISGRALGITGGTLDKLESIPGFTTRLTREQIVRQVQEIGVAMAGQTERMVPADRILYGLRDVTGTVPSLPLITASILSRKLAESLDTLVLDVKFGDAAFMNTRPEAEALGRTMVELANDCGVPTRFLLNDMNQPLGRAVGNWLEVKESVECLSGGGPAGLRALVLEFAAQLLDMTGKASGIEAGKSLAAAALDSGTALERWNAMLVAQGANFSEYQRALEGTARAGIRRELKTKAGGRITRIDARTIGEVLRRHGAGRLRHTDRILPEVGLVCGVEVGQALVKGQLLAEIHAANETHADEMAAALLGAFRIDPGV